MNSHNQSWSSSVSTSQPTTHHLGRSTSEEYEQAAASANTKRLQVSGRPGPSSRSHAARKPISKSASFRNGVPDSEAEEDQPLRKERGKSPFEEVMDVAKNVYGAASFYLKQSNKSQLAEPGEPRNAREESYDYEAEEQDYQSQTSARRSNPTAVHRRNRMSEDNRAYKPAVSDYESDEDYESDGKTKRRKKKKKEPAGTMNNLPVISTDKRRKKKSKVKRGAAAGAEEEEGSESDEPSVEQVPRTSLRPDPSRHPSLPRNLAPPNDHDPNYSTDIEPGLLDIPEEEEEEYMPDTSGEVAQELLAPQRRSVSKGPPSRIGGPLGQLVHYLIAKSLSLTLLIWNLFTGLLYLFGGLLGHAYDLLFRLPFSWISQAFSGPLFKPLLVALLLIGLFTQRGSLLQLVPIPRLGGKPPVYQAPDIPAANIAEIAARLQTIEQTLSDLSQRTENGRILAESEGKVQSELIGRLGLLEMKVGSESRKSTDVETRVREITREGIGLVRQELEALQAQVQASQQRHQVPSRSAAEPATDEEARARVRALEERVGTVEGGVREALEMGKKVASSPSSNAGPSAAWWNKLASGSAAKSGLTIKSSDGQDVTSLIGHLVDTAVLTYSKDTIARADYAAYSGGARVIPSLTSPTYEITPSTLRGSLLSYITGNGYAIGRPPVWALHHELQNGHCWPVAGHTGQLGVVLAAPIYVDEVTIDHVASEVAFDMRSAPRDMELWGLVEGQDNTEKIREWREERSRRREDGEELVEEPEQPNTLPRAASYVRIAEFTYDVGAPRNVQTFPVNSELRALGIDFGVVVLMMKSNWGRDYTCLYRLRVHGQRKEEPVPPTDESGEVV
ncbi:hypothetical protein H0H87_005420 [Tephrocybe sp. NHM501043]|nr:hypothetical protein H0H87_005420 [Tephrocybe sp. NHM501043]